MAARTRLAALAATALVSGCYTPGRVATPAEVNLVGHARAAYEARRGPVDCPILSRVRVVTDPEQFACGRRPDAEACSRPSGWDPGGRTLLIFVRLARRASDPPDVNVAEPGEFPYLVQHEALHWVRACHHRGEAGSSDPFHEDAELWYRVSREASIEDDAWRRAGLR